MRHHPPPELIGLRHEIHAWLRRRALRRGLGYLLDDLLGVADVALIEAARRHDPARGPLPPFAHLRVKRETLRYLGREQREDHAPLTLAEPHRLCPPVEPVSRRLVALLADPRPARQLVVANLLDGEGRRVLAARHGLTEHQLRRESRALLDAVRALLEAPQPAHAPTGDSRPQRPHFDGVSAPHSPPDRGGRTALKRAPRRPQRPRRAVGTLSAEHPAVTTAATAITEPAPFSV
jgi:hypothetical protein